MHLAEGRTHNLELADDAIEIYQGTYKVDISQALGQPGLPWKSGWLFLDQRPDLRIRPMPGTPSMFWDLRTHPLVAGLLRRVTSVLCGTDFRLDRPSIPFWLKDKPQSEQVMERQFEYCARIFHDWKQHGRAGFKGWLQSVITTTVIQGWSWYEITAHPRIVSLDGDLHEVYWPEPLAYRAPWSVRYFLQQREELAGIVAEFHYQNDYSGNSGPSRVVIPAEKILIVTTNALGPTDYLGRSYLRDCINEIKAYRDAFQLEQLGTSVNALGELFFTLPPGGISQEGQAALEDYIMSRTAQQVPGGVLPDGVTVSRLAGEIPRLGDLLDRLNRQIAMCFNQDDRLIAVGQHGSYAARAAASADVRDSMDEYIESLVALPLQEYFRRMITLSFPDDVAEGLLFLPEVGWGMVEERDVGVYVNTLSQAKSAELISWSEPDEQVLRDLLDLTPTTQQDVIMAESVDDVTTGLQQLNYAMSARFELLEDLLSEHGDDVNTVVSLYSASYSSDRNAKDALSIARRYLQNEGIEPEDNAVDLADLQADAMEQLASVPKDLIYFIQAEMKKERKAGAD